MPALRIFISLHFNSLFYFTLMGKHLKRDNSKKKNKKEKHVKQLDSVEYDANARHEFITGFHKRKLQCKKDRVAKAVEREKEEKREHRRSKQKKLTGMLPELDKLEEIIKKCTNVSSVELHQGLETRTTVTIEDFDVDEL